MSQAGGIWERRAKLVGDRVESRRSVRSAPAFHQAERQNGTADAGPPGAVFAHPRNR